MNSVSDQDVEEIFGDASSGQRTTPTPPLAGRRASPVVPAGWPDAHVEKDALDDYVPSLPNVAGILAFDPQVAGTFAYNEFAQQVRAMKPITSERLSLLAPREICDPVNGDLIESYHIVQARLLLSAERGADKDGWGIDADEPDLEAAIRVAAEHHRFNPVKEELERQRRNWDGARGRLDEMFIRSMGAPDNIYVREIARLWIIGSIARTYSPGHIFDMIPVLIGPEGQGKSRFGSLLFGERYFGGYPIGWKRNLEQAQRVTIGKRGNELGDVRAVIHAGVDAKIASFLNTTTIALPGGADEFPAEHHRTTVFFAHAYKKYSPMIRPGQNRFWPVVTHPSDFDLDWLRDNRDQLWGEAMQAWWEICLRHDYRNLPLSLSSQAVEVAMRLN